MPESLGYALVFILAIPGAVMGFFALAAVIDSWGKWS